MDILARIIELRDSRKWTEYQLAERADLAQSTISSWYRKGFTPSIDSIEKLCKGFGITLSQFFVGEGELLVGLTQEQMDMLDQWNRLDDEQKKHLMAFLQSL